MKKIAILLALAMALSCCLLMLASCGDSDDTSSSADTSSAASSGDTSSAASSSDTSSSASTSSAASSADESEESSSAASSEEETTSDASDASSEESEESSEEESSEPEQNPNANENTDGSNLAAGKSYEKSELFRQDASYQWSADAEITYPDTDDAELTDGVFPESGATYSDEAFMGFAGSPDYQANGYAYVTVDLEDSYKISQIVLYVGTSALGGGIGVPASVEFLVSEDGATFTSVGKVTPADDPNNPYVAVSLDCEVTGQYVQARIVNGGWMFVCELEVY